MGEKCKGKAGVYVGFSFLFPSSRASVMAGERPNRPVTY